MVRLPEMGLEEIEGRFFERFGRIPDADESMLYYTMETKSCPLCGAKRLNSVDDALDHWVNKHELEIPKIMVLGRDTK